jgi:hypothetical protein
LKTFTYFHSFHSHISGACEETSGGGLLYVRLNHPQAAQELIAMEVPIIRFLEVDVRQSFKPLIS